MRSAPEAKVRFYLDLFRCRPDIYAIRWENRQDGRSGWMPAIRGRWRTGMSRSEASYLPLTDEVVAAHLRGAHHIGLYPLGDDDTCWWVAADFDKDLPTQRPIRARYRYALPTRAIDRSAGSYPAADRFEILRAADQSLRRGPDRHRGASPGRFTVDPEGPGPLPAP
ncbi:TOTE conflict system archaeo-eukaryotic primase domain-containing protein [Nocardia sp. R16R-3T]